MAVTGSRRVILEVALFVASQAAAWYTIKWMLDTFNPTSPSKKLSPNSKQMLALQRLGHLNLELDEYERIIANEIIHPSDIPTRFSDIGGLDSIILSLRESIIYPLLYPQLFTSSSLLGPPKGVLLYGPPGCGKTMLAKALAKESNATFLNISASVLTNKWFGESNKLVAGLFGLARKTQPCIIFVDEMDCFLRERRDGDHEVMGMLKAEFMMLWDGLLSSEDRILVLGATNRPGDIDQAFLRRMPKRFSVGLPDEGQRGKILSLLLKDTPLAPISTSSPAFRVLASHAKTSTPTSTPTSNTDPDSSSTNPDSSFHRTQLITLLAEASTGMSGSDLKEACRAAAMVPVREGLRETMHKMEVERSGRQRLDSNDLDPSPDPDLNLGGLVGGFGSIEGNGNGNGNGNGKGKGEGEGEGKDLHGDMKSFTPRSLKIEDFVTAAQGEGGGSGISVLAGNLVRMARERLERLEEEEGLELAVD